MENLYARYNFQFLVMYGRRKVGKTLLLREISKKHRTIFFSAQEQNDDLNMEDFSRTVQRHFDSSFFGTFYGWETAFQYIGDKTSNEKTVLIIDEFPFVSS